jgi:hypothetical protein
LFAVKTSWQSLLRRAGVRAADVLEELCKWWQAEVLLKKMQVRSTGRSFKTQCLFKTDNNF